MGHNRGLFVGETDLLVSPTASNGGYSQCWTSLRSPGYFFNHWLVVNNFLPTRYLFCFLCTRDPIVLFSRPSPIMTTFHFIRHGEALHKYDTYVEIVLNSPWSHSVQRGYDSPNPRLTSVGLAQAQTLGLELMDFSPSAVVTSPMSRTVETAYAAFPLSLGSRSLHIWPDLREAHDAICNKGESRAIVEFMFPSADFSLCSVEWDYEPHTVERATQRAERVRQELLKLPGPDVVVIGHRGFLAYLVETGKEFEHCGALFPTYIRVIYLVFDRAAVVPLGRSRRGKRTANGDS
jgi:broad specificity phosphatase PhoE